MGRTIKLVIYYFVYQLVFTALFTIPAAIGQVMNGNANPETLASNTGKATGSMIAIPMVLSGIAMVWHLIHFKYVTFNKASWTKVPQRTLLLSIPFLVAAMLSFNIISEFLQLPNMLEETFMSMARNPFGIIAIAIMAPLVEELLFRGAIEGHLLRSGHTPRTAIIASALVFGIIHINPAQVPFAFCLGLIFGWLYYRTGSVVPGILGHFLNNSIATFFMATAAPEEMNRTTADMIGFVPTCLLLAAAIITMVGMFLYLNKHLPAAPQYSETINE